MNSNELRAYINIHSNDEYKRYSFMKRQEGFLAYKNNLHPLARSLLNRIKFCVKWLLDKQQKNEENNKSILRSLGLPEDSVISRLDAVNKKKFNKQKYIGSFKPKVQKDLPEPKADCFAFIPGERQAKNRIPPEEFLKKFKNQ